MKRTDKQQRAGVELRAAERAEGREDGGLRIEGKAISFDSPTLIYTDMRGVDYYEVIDAHALDGADTDDCCLRYNHSLGVMVLARTRGGSLRLEKRSDGMHFTAELFDTSVSRDVYELVRQEALQCSFAFLLPPEGGYRYDADTHTRTITRIERLIDLSVVDVPAYKDTFVQARSLFELDSAEEAARLESRARRRALIARTI